MIGNFFFYAANLSNIIPLAIFFIYFSQTKKVDYAKAVAVSSIYVLAIFAFYLLYPQDDYGKFDAVNQFGEFMALAAILYFSLNSSLLRKVVMFAGIAFTIFYIIYLSLYVITEIDPIITSVKSIILIVLSLLVFYEKFQKETDRVIYYDYRFWGLIGLFIYISGTFLFNLVYAEYYEEMKDLEGIPLTLFLLKSIFLAISMILLIKQTRHNTQKKEKDIPFLDLE